MKYTLKDIQGIPTYSRKHKEAKRREIARKMTKTEEATKEAIRIR